MNRSSCRLEHGLKWAQGRNQVLDWRREGALLRFGYVPTHCILKSIVCGVWTQLHCITKVCAAAVVPGIAGSPYHYCSNFFQKSIAAEPE